LNTRLRVLVDTDGDPASNQYQLEYRKQNADGSATWKKVLPSNPIPTAPIIIGTPQSGSVIDGQNVTLTFSTTPQAGDMVILWGGHPHRAGSVLGPSTAGYIPITTNTAAAPNFGVWYKIMGGSPDSTVVGRGTANTADATAYAAYVIRGFDQSQPFDVASTTAGPTTSTNPNPPAITTNTMNVLVMALSGSQVLDTTPGTIDLYGNTVSASGDDTNDISVAGATRVIVGQRAEDPVAWSSWSSGAWFSVTLAIKPAFSTAFRGHLGEMGKGGLEVGEFLGGDTHRLSESRT